MSYLVSVVVPTKNRYKYLKHLIKLVDSFQLPELEFVIQDNSDDNSEILSFLKSYSNPHIKYFYSTDALTMSQNGELAIRRSTGDYVCYIGDDDGVCRNIVDCARWMKSKRLMQRSIQMSGIIGMVMQNCKHQRMDTYSMILKQNSIHC